MHAATILLHRHFALGARFGVGLEVLQALIFVGLSGKPLPHHVAGGGLVALTAAAGAEGLPAAAGD